MSAAAGAARVDQILHGMLRRDRQKTDRLFLYLLAIQWGLAIVIALVLSPYAWAGSTRTVHFHVYVAVWLGAAINTLPAILILRRPGETSTRHVVAACQMLWSALLIHLTGGRIETHFHVFGSLAFLAFYRDWRVLPTATAAVAADHLIRAFIWPESVYGVANPAWWRFLEHAAWVTFENIVLAYGCLRSVREMRAVAERQAAFEGVNARIEQEVTLKTAELLASMTHQRKMEIELRQAQKLESVGRLAAGVAHEINTPVQFVSDSVHFVRGAMQDVAGLIDQYRQALATPAPGAAAVRCDLAKAEEDADLSYLLENVPKALDRSLEGLDRVATIVRSMKEFAHPDSTEMADVDLNRALESTLIIARNEYKYVADVETDLADLPKVRCHAGDVNQVILNILVNAAHAIEDVVRGSDGRGRIIVRTRLDHDAVVISISDTGGGIPASIRDRVFDPFFTTKEVGRGSGQGLAIARAVIVEKHGGQLTFDTQDGAGSTFVIRLPIDGKPGPARDAVAPEARALPALMAGTAAGVA